MQELAPGLQSLMSINEKLVAVFAGEKQTEMQTIPQDRILHIPLGAEKLVGVATGMAAYGLQPVVHLSQEELYSGAYLQLMQASSQYRYRSGGQFASPLVLIVEYDSCLQIEPMLLQIPGLEVFAPSCIENLQNLFNLMLLVKDPMVFFVPKKWPEMPENVKECWRLKKAGKQAAVLSEGSDVSLLSYGACTAVAFEAMEELATEGLSVELIDLNSLREIDQETIFTSVQKTGRVLILQDSAKSYGVAAEISAQISESQIEHLLAPIRRVAAMDLPFSDLRSAVSHPDAGRVAQAIRDLKSFQ